MIARCEEGVDVVSAIISQHVFRLMADTFRNERNKLNANPISMGRLGLSRWFGESIALWVYTLQIAAVSNICRLAEQFVDENMMYLLEWWALTASRCHDGVLSVSIQHLVLFDLLPFSCRNARSASVSAQLHTWTEKFRLSPTRGEIRASTAINPHSYDQAAHRPRCLKHMASYLRRLPAELGPETGFK